MPRLAALACSFVLPIASTTFVEATSTSPCVAQESRGAPPVFSKLSFDQALARTKDTQLVLVVKATASWCAPCKRMNQTTWVDDKVVAWFASNGLAIEFDVDEQAALAKQLAIHAMPTMVAFKAGKEFDRVVGYKDAGELLAWLAGVQKGEKSIVAVESHARAAQGGEQELDARYDLAKQLSRGSELDRATDEYAWVWTNSKNVPAYGGVRVSFMASDMRKLATRHAPARARFRALRDELTPRLDGDKVARDDVRDWITLNDVIADESATLAWFDRVKAEPRWVPLLHASRHALEDLLEQQGRWAEMLWLHPQPLSELKQDFEFVQMVIKLDLEPGSAAPDSHEDEWSMFRQSTATLHAMLLAAGKDAQAAEFRSEALKLDDSPQLRIALVKRALDAKQARAELRALLDAAESKDPEKHGAQVRSARRKLDKLLAAPGVDAGSDAAAKDDVADEPDHERAPKQSLGELEARVAQAKPGTYEEADARYERADAYAEAGKYAEATDEYAWVWEHTKSLLPFGGVRGSFLASDMKELVGLHELARTRFTALRDDAQKRIDAAKVKPLELLDWVVLNDVVGDEARTLDWFDKAKSDQKTSRSLPFLALYIEPLLEQRGRWADLAVLYPKPIAKLRGDHGLLTLALQARPKSIGDAMLADMSESQAERFCTSAGTLHAALLAAGRDAEATEVRAEAVKLDDSARMRVALVTRALDARQAREHLAQLLDEADALTAAQPAAPARESVSADARAQRSRLAEQLAAKPATPPAR